jgi:hypothetical protein
MAEIRAIRVSTSLFLALRGVLFRWHRGRRAWDRTRPACSATQSPTLHSLSTNAYGIYLIHYPFVVWLQFAMLELALPAV